MRRMPSRYVPIALSVPTGLFACVMAGQALLLGVRLGMLTTGYPEWLPPLIAADTDGQVAAYAVLLGAGVLLWLTAAVAATLYPRPWALRLLRAGCFGVYALFALWSLQVLRLTGAAAYAVPADGVPLDALTVFHWRLLALRLPALAALGAAVLHLTAWRATVIRAFGGRLPPGGMAPGDTLIENLRTHGPHPEYRKSMWGSVGVHVMAILILPWLLSLRGCMDPYLVPRGSGEPEISVVPVQVVRVERKKRYLLNPHAAISFLVPELDDSKTLQEVEQITRLTYQADPSRVAGALGTGGGTQGGWPDGMDKGLVRFIRLQYGGPGWDDGMDSVSRSDRNFLEHFRQLTGFKTAALSESHPVADLARYPPGFAPPFVYMTGIGAINISPRDLRILREYLYGGGMLFADCGSPAFDASFRRLTTALFPAEPLRVIADDDPIFQFPFRFPNGAPPLWHHGGQRALGVRQRNRWMVFYHPGDLKDAWRSGHSGLAPPLARAAMDLGVNIVYHAFTQYLEQTRNLRK